MPELPDHYKLFGVSQAASAAEIKSRYLALAKELHPDRHGGDLEKEDRMKQVSVAYRTLCDEDKRKAYDKQWQAIYGKGRLNPLKRARIATERVRPTATSRTPVTSTIFRAIGYDPDHELLEIEFRTGAIFQYLDVPDFIHTEFMRTDKKGTFYRTHILGTYRERCRK